MREKRKERKQKKSEHTFFRIRDHNGITAQSQEQSIIIHQNSTVQIHHIKSNYTQGDVCKKGSLQWQKERLKSRWRRENGRKCMSVCERMTNKQLKVETLFCIFVFFQTWPIKWNTLWPFTGQSATLNKSQLTTCLNTTVTGWGLNGSSVQSPSECCKRWLGPVPIQSRSWALASGKTLVTVAGWGSFLPHPNQHVLSFF